MSLRLPVADIPAILGRYEYPLNENALLAFQNRILRTKVMTLGDLCAVCDWKAPRAAGHARKNTELEVKEITKLALSAKSERVRIEGLQVLHGVSYPTASVILHFFHQDIYPIIDFRALWTMGMAQPTQYTFGFWWEYVEACRKLLLAARRHHPSLSMRELDRALWQYSKENQAAP
jgi:hypothetical protein